MPIHPKHLVDVDLGQRWYLDHIEPSMRVLDVGCGNGVHSIRVAKEGASTVAMDYDLRHLEVGCALSVVGVVDSVSFVGGDAEASLPFCSRQFDLVLLLDVIEHLHNRHQLLREVYRVLRHGGKLVLSAPNRDTSWKRRLRSVGLPSHTDPDHRIEYTEEELMRELAQSGFGLDGELVPVVYDTPWAGLIDLSGGLSLSLYRRLVRWKVDMALKHPKETIGWRVVCSRTGS